MPRDSALLLVGRRLAGRQLNQSRDPISGISDLAQHLHSGRPWPYGGGNLIGGILRHLHRNVLGHGETGRGVVLVDEAVGWIG